MSGSDMMWRQEAEASLDGGVVSLSLGADGSELLAGTQEGSVYRVLPSDLSSTKVRGVLHTDRHGRTRRWKAPSLGDTKPGR